MLKPDRSDINCAMYVVTSLPVFSVNCIWSHGPLSNVISDADNALDCPLYCMAEPGCRHHKVARLAQGPIHNPHGLPKPPQFWILPSVNLSQALPFVWCERS